MADEFDLIVLGSGPAATRVANRCAKERWRVAVVDPRPVGGTCALHGCNPKKVLVRAAELVDRARKMHGHGTNLGDAVIDWGDLVRFKRTFTEPVSEGKRQSFEELGIEIIQGGPQFTSPTELNVDGRRIEAAKILVATGAKPAPLPFEGAEFLTTSDEFMELSQLPKRVTFIGGGYISFEFAHVAVRSGVQVSIIEKGRPLENFDADLVDCLVNRSQAIGIEVHLHTGVESIQRQSDGTFLVHLSAQESTSQIETDLVVHGAGRVPNLDGLNLDAANVRFDEAGIQVNEFLQSVSNEAVYAAGDVVASKLPPLTPVANYHGRIVAANLFEPNSRRVDDVVVPYAVYTSPSLAAVGLTEAEANRQGIPCVVQQGDWSQFSSMKKVGETHAMYKVLVDDRGRILGAHLLGPEAAETINIFTLAMKLGATVDDFDSTLFTFPSFVADIHSMT